MIIVETLEKHVKNLLDDNGCGCSTLQAACRWLINLPAGAIDGYTEVRAMLLDFLSSMLECLDNATETHKWDPKAFILDHIDPKKVKVNPQAVKAVFQPFEDKLKAAKLKELPLRSALDAMNATAPNNKLGNFISKFSPGTKTSFSDDDLDDICNTFKDVLSAAPPLTYTPQWAACEEVWRFFNRMPKSQRTAIEVDLVGSIPSAVASAAQKLRRSFRASSGVQPAQPAGRSDGAHTHEFAAPPPLPSLASIFDTSPHMSAGVANSHSSGDASFMPGFNSGAHTNGYAASPLRPSVTSKLGASPRTSACVPVARVGGGASRMPRCSDGFVASPLQPSITSTFNAAPRTSADALMARVSGGALRMPRCSDGAFTYGYTASPLRPSVVSVLDASPRTSAGALVACVGDGASRMPRCSGGAPRPPGFSRAAAPPSCAAVLKKFAYA